MADAHAIAVHVQQVGGVQHDCQQDESTSQGPQSALAPHSGTPLRREPVHLCHNATTTVSRQGGTQGALARAQMVHGPWGCDVVAGARWHRW